MDTKGKDIVEEGQSQKSFMPESFKRVHLEDEEVVTDLKKQKSDKHNFEEAFEDVWEPDSWDLDSPMDDVDISYDSWDMLERLWEKNQWSHSSFDNSELWKCLRFCYLFPRNYEFHKDDLIQLWIAQDFFPFPSNSGKDLEGSFQIYFDKFERCHILQLSSFDCSTRQARYMLNASVVGLLEEKTDDDYFREGDVNSVITENTLHSSFPDSIDAFTLKDLYQTRKLCTLLIFHVPGSNFNIPRDLFLKLSWLRALDLSDTSIVELPSSIGKLKELRYLDLSRTPLTTLPNTLCSLCQMQTLKLKGCLKLAGLPKGMRKLVNLRHLDVDLACLLVSMPPGMGDLKYLQSLPAFIVGTEHGYHITELKHMSNLMGTLRILRLENVPSLEEAKVASLDEKKYLTKLEFQWIELEDGLQLLENLQPHKDLEELQIIGYGSAKFPSWIGDPIFSILSTITIHSCRICKILPPLGKLSSLYDLSITEMHEVIVIDHTFCGRTTEMGSFDLSIQPFEYLTHSANSTNVKAFPRLEKLTLNGMPKLEKWTGIEEGDFCKLQKLSISCCIKLAALPNLVFLKSLQQLDISYCPLLQFLPNEGLPTSLEFLAIVDCPLLKEWCLNDVKQHSGMIAGIQHVWIDYQLISQGSFGISHEQALALPAKAQAAQSQLPSEYSSSTLAPPTTSFDNQPSYRNIPLQMHDPRIAMVESSVVSYSESRSQPPHDKPGDDGYNWRKYRQKQVKGSEFPWSYYRCAHPNCAVKKKVERSLDGHATEIVYDGHHNHQRPHNAQLAKDGGNSDGLSHVSGNLEMGSLDLGKSIKTTAAVFESRNNQKLSQGSPEHLSVSSDCEKVGNAEIIVDEEHEDQPDPNRINTEVSPSASASIKTSVTESRTVVQTTSTVDILDDGYRWRNYGQKDLLRHPFPRSYYKCMTKGCPARKHVQRSSTDINSVITTYMGIHIHHAPAAKDISHTGTESEVHDK